MAENTEKNGPKKPIGTIIHVLLTMTLAASLAFLSCKYQSLENRIFDLESTTLRVIQDYKPHHRVARQAPSSSSNDDSCVCPPGKLFQFEHPK